MTTRNLLNLGLLALIGVLVLLVVYEPGIEPPPPTPTLLQLDKASINHLAIHRDDQQEVVLVKERDNKWWMEKPVHHPADAYRIDSLLRITELKSQSSFAADENRLAEYQLDTPRASLTLNDETTLAFGGSTPLDQRRYVMVDGRVHLTTDSYYYHLIGSFPGFLRKQLLDEGSNIEVLTLPGLSLRWQENRWQLSPEPESFSADQVTRLIDNWKLASALEVKPYDGKPGEQITIKLSGVEQPLELLLTVREPDLVLARPDLGIQYHFDAAASEQLLQLPSMEQEQSATEAAAEGRDDEDGTAAEDELAH